MYLPAMVGVDTEDEEKDVGVVDIWEEIEMIELKLDGTIEAEELLGAILLLLLGIMLVIGALLMTLVV